MPCSADRASTERRDFDQARQDRRKHSEELNTNLGFIADVPAPLHLAQVHLTLRTCIMGQVVILLFLQSSFGIDAMRISIDGLEDESLGMRSSSIDLW